MKFCQGALQDEDSTLPVVSRHLGKLCHGLSHYMTDKQKAWFLDFYKKLCAMGVNDSSHSERNSDINDNLAPKVNVDVSEAGIVTMGHLTTVTSQSIFGRHNGAKH